MSAIVGHRRARTKADDISRLPETIGTHDAVGPGEADQVWSRPSSFRRTPSVVNARLITLVIPAHAGTSPRNQQNRRVPRPHPEIPEFAWMTGWGAGMTNPLVIPAHAGISSRNQHNRPAQQSRAEIPALAGMTGGGLSKPWPNGSRRARQAVVSPAVGGNRAARSRRSGRPIRWWVRSRWSPRGPTAGAATRPIRASPGAGRGTCAHRRRSSAPPR